METRFRLWSSWQKWWRRICRKVVHTGGGLSENSEEKSFSQEVTSVGLEREVDDEVNFDTLLHSSCGWLRVLRERMDTCLLLKSNTAFQNSLLVDWRILRIKPDLGRSRSTQILNQKLWRFFARCCSGSSLQPFFREPTLILSDGTAAEAATLIEWVISVRLQSKSRLLPFSVVEKRWKGIFRQHRIQNTLIQWYINIIPMHLPKPLRLLTDVWNK